MTIKDCIDRVDNQKPNQYTITEKVMWLSFIEEIIINDVLKTHEGYDGRYDNFEGYSEDKLTVTLIVPSPYDRLYTQYLKMKIDETNGETTRYNNSATLFNSYMAEYRKYYNKTHMPLDTSKPRAMKPPATANVNLTDAEFEAIVKELTVVLKEYFSGAVAPNKIYDIVMKYMQNNAEMFKGKDVIQNLKDGENGSVYMDDNVAQAEDSVMLGKGGVTGVKAYYIKSIDFENKKIYLCKTQPVIPSLTEHEVDPSILEDEEFYEVGDTFSIISEFHYPACGTIADIDENRIITYAEDLPFTEVFEDANYDGNTFNVAEKPFVGCVTLGLRGFGGGTDNIVGGESGAALGRGGVVLDAFGTVIGYFNRAGYAAIALNALTEALGQHSLTTGQRTKTTAKAKNGVAGGFNTVSNAENQVVFGTFNIIDEEGTLVFILGNGKNDVARSNAFTVDKDGNVWLAGVVRSDKDGICLESDIIKLGSSTTNSIKAEKGICIGNVNNILATAKQSVQIGDGNTAAGEKTMQIGTSNRAPTANGYVYQIGYANVSNFGQSYMFGKLLESGEYEQVIQGRYNEAVTDAIYVLGNGTSTKKKNALVIKKSTDDAMFEGDVYSKGKKVATQTEIDALNTKIKAFENGKVEINDSLAGLYSEIASLTERIASVESKLN